MNELISLTLAYISIGIFINTFFYNMISKITKYDGNIQGDWDMGIITPLVLVFGPIMLLFYKNIKIYRKHRYLKNRINYYKCLTNPMYFEVYDSELTDQIKKLEKIYKLSIIKQKTKRNKIKNKFKIKNQLCQYFK